MGELKDVATPRDLVLRLVLAELLARRGEGPLALRRFGSAGHVPPRVAVAAPQPSEKGGTEPR